MDWSAVEEIISISYPHQMTREVMKKQKHTVKQLFFAAIYFRVFVFGDIFAAIYFRGFQKQENNFREFIMLWPIKRSFPFT